MENNGNGYKNPTTPEEKRKYYQEHFGNPHSPEVKARAAYLLKQRIPPNQIAKALNVPVGTIYSWRKKMFGPTLIRVDNGCYSGLERPATKKVAKVTVVPKVTAEVHRKIIGYIERGAELVPIYGE